MDPVIQEVVEVASRAAYDQLFDLLATIDDGLADDVLAWMLRRHWLHADMTGNAKLVEWLALGRTVEEISGQLGSGFGHGKAAAPGRKRQMMELVTLLYELAQKYMTQLSAYDKELADEDASDSQD